MLWIVAATVANAPLVTLVAVVIALPGQSDPAVGGIGCGAAGVAAAIGSAASSWSGRGVTGTYGRKEARRLEHVAEPEQLRRDKIGRLLIQGSAARLLNSRTRS